MFDVLYALEGTPVGFGFIDVMKDTQETIDALDADIQFNARLLAKPRYLTKAGSGVNVAELADYSKDFVEVTGDPAAAVYALPVRQLDASVIDFRERKIQEMKETSGNRDFNQGGAASGVTAASAISMLQEAGNKLSRDSIKASYRAFVEECRLVLELIRQFYDSTRVFRITEPNGDFCFLRFDNSAMQAVEQEWMGVDCGAREPVFDIKVSAQKQSPFSQISHNQFVMEMFEKGFFNPAVADQAILAVSHMDFEGKEKLLAQLGK